MGIAIKATSQPSMEKPSLISAVESNVRYVFVRKELSKMACGIPIGGKRVIWAFDDVFVS